ncbi:hypothetical protein PsorP6_014844 [Peronosclerospora sorghi]|uniref:Uncharacterized protein n=1 Tax=Peronosclerospora sorghi TaxID=230839 RepID=A0ACC0VSX4_9STRA|nr:hypothetical protein PsorP6_014844 [Peronosclerospora sorghi]
MSRRSFEMGSWRKLPEPLKFDRGKSRRQISSILSGFPFLVVAKEDENRLWKLKVCTGDHNHAPSSSETAHPVHLRLPEHLSKSIVDLSIPVLLQGLYKRKCAVYAKY